MTKLRTDEEIMARPRCDWHDLFNVDPEFPAEIAARMDSYFAPFLCPTFEPERTPEGKHVFDQQPCVGCGTHLLSLAGASLGIAHGEGNCAVCFWPVRVLHKIDMPDGANIMVMHHVPLQYGPEAVNLARWRERFGGDE